MQNASKKYINRLFNIFFQLFGLFCFYRAHEPADIVINSDAAFLGHYLRGCARGIDKHAIDSAFDIATDVRTSVLSNPSDDAIWHTQEQRKRGIDQRHPQHR